MVPFWLTVAAWTTDAAIQKKVFDSGTTLVFSNKEIDDIMKLIRSLEDAALLIKGVCEKVEQDVKEQQKGEFLAMLAASLGANLLGNMLAGRRVVRAG